LRGRGYAVADRVVSLLKRVGIEPEFVISGGIGRNIGVVKRVEAELGLLARIPEEPQTSARWVQRSSRVKLPFPSDSSGRASSPNFTEAVEPKSNRGDWI
jgi:hypothetical protein